ncbi:hypothetical protein ACFL2V_00750 [Pseudomonadota bacterium]
MNWTRYCIAALVVLFAVFPVHASELEHDEILIIDEGTVFKGDLAFVDGSDDQPKKSDFKIENYFLMSSRSGERWATITLKNSAKGQRILSEAQVMAVFANGEKRAPNSMKHTFAEDEVATLAVTFGKSKFPVLYVYTRN